MFAICRLEFSKTAVFVIVNSRNGSSAMHRRRYYSVAKGVNCNKPLRAERERHHDEHENAETSSERSRRGNRHPAGLKGKEIGLWYSKRNKMKEPEKPVMVGLNSSINKEIENVLLHTQERTLTEDDNTHYMMRDSLFKRTFLNKISVSFEDKLEGIQPTVIQQIPEVDERLYEELMKKSSNKEFQTMQVCRRSLPAYEIRKEIVDFIESSRVSVISGATGCGKSTQIAQYVLDHYIHNKKGSLFKAICTQPRRISAITLAERVASERGERLGESVGYVIRLESRVPLRSRGTITFETTGILTTALQYDPVMDGVSHLFVDEIHERNTLCDFLITLLKYIIPKRPDLKVILMSASLNAEKFSEYFNGAPCLDIPGITFPVQEFYLEDVLQKVHFRFSDTGRAVKMTPEFMDHVLPYVNTLKAQNVPGSVLNELRNPASEILNVNFITKVILYICEHEPEGAILVFLPGLNYIQDVIKGLTPYKSHKLSIFAMHSLLPTVNQKMPFMRPPPGVRKVIVSTPITETSITIDDVRYVVDCGKHKEKSFDLQKNVSTLEPEWESAANALQRKGRAGRTAPGKCFKLYTRAREQLFEPFPLPEIQRSRLEQVVLNAKILQLGQVEQFLEKVMDPPDTKAVKLSVKMLRTLNMLDSEERLTPLGYHVAKLPMDPQTAKMILMGALFGCLDPILSIAACLNFKDPFVFILNEEEKINRIRKEFARGSKSDHVMLSNAFKAWEEAYDERRGQEFAYSKFLSHHNLLLMRNLKSQFANILKEMKFLISEDPRDVRNNFNSNNVKLIEAVVCSGLYPNVAMIKRVKKGKVNSKSKRTFWKTVDHPNVEFHPKSLMSKIDEFESPFVVYFEKLKNKAIFLHDGTMVNPMTLLFFGERLDIVNEDGNYIQVDDMVKFSCSKTTAELVQKLRNQLLWILDEAVSNPCVVDWTEDNEKTRILNSIVELITTDDFGRWSA